MSPSEVWSADFETTTDPNDCRVWLWGVEEVFTAERHWWTDIQSFVEFCEDHDKAKIYFHNLAFDGSFIIDYLLHNGYYHVPGKKALRKKNFHTLISRSGHFYSINVRWANGTRTEFRDSLKKIPLSVSNISEAFGISEHKLEIDYDAPRPVGYKPTREERLYLFADITIVGQALRVELEEGMTRLTVGADSLAEYKRTIGDKHFNTLFPILPLSMDAEIRQAYRGGWTIADDRFSKRIVGPGRSYDVNSLYPSVMYDRVLPYGMPIFAKGKPKEIEGYPLFITSITFTAKLKSDHVPCIQVKNSPSFVATKYQGDIDNMVTMACTNVDLDLWNEHYDLDIISYNGTWYFKGAQGFFCQYIDKWMKVKIESEGGMRTIAKLHLNSLYGKFATNPDVTPKIPYLNEKGVVQLKVGEHEERQPVYTAMGVFITAYARDVTIRAAQDNYDVFAYADTDSLHLMVEDDPDNLDIDSYRLGAWKHEMTYSKAMYVRAKCYTELDVKPYDIENKGPRWTGDEGGESYVTHIAGLPERIAKHVTFEDYTEDRSFGGKLLPKRVNGGIVLEQTRFKLNL